MTTGRKADTSQVEVVSTVAHELQTPLAAVKAAATELTRAGEAGADVRERLLQIVLDGVAQLSRLVDDLLVAGQLDTGVLAPAAEACDAAAIARDAAALAEAASGGGRAVAVEPGPAAVLADPQQLRQVLTNLVANALAHGQGTVTVGFERSGNRARLTVSDEGPGIPAEARERIFERYARLPGGSVRGTGLGLAIARELTEAMGGTMAALPRDPRGTTFVVELPAAEPSRRAGRSRGTTAGRARARRTPD